jgi:DNA-binding transcriptional regulator YhcF (GntR family)
MQYEQPRWVQIKEIIEDFIITGRYKVDDFIISTTEISRFYNVNPNTAMKVISNLTENDILYKRYGMGMCVKEGALEKISERRRVVFMEKTVERFVIEAKKIGLPIDEVINIIRERWLKND